MRSPFKFLDAYTFEDREVFFGREEETDTLYQLLFKSPLLLLYGMSGTGKTSLIQCGLANRFDGTDWFPFFIRRQQDMNDTLRGVLRKAVPEGEAPPVTLTDTVNLLFRYYLRPVYLIFDQLEELFILGSEEEQETFGQTLRTLLDADLPCKILLVMREEFIGQLYRLERVVPTVYDFRLRIEPMGYKKVEQVIRQSCDHFNIRLESPEQNVTQIYANLSAGRSGVQLPYLQVYLDLLYQEDLKRTYPEGNYPEALPPLVFTTEEIEHFGGIEDVLGRFLHQQEAELQQALSLRYAQAPANAVTLLLDAFVTEEGTKRPLRYRREQHRILLEEPAAGQLAGLEADGLTFLLERLINARLIRDRDDNLELAHDALAALIDHRRSDQQRLLNEAFNRLLNNYREFRDTREYLTRKQLNYLEDYLPDLRDRLDKEVEAFIEQSYAECRRRENLELDLERSKRRQTARIAVAGFVLSFLLLAAFLLAFWQWNQARRAKVQLARSAFEAQLNAGEALKVEGKYDQALAVLNEAATLDRDLTAAQREALRRRQRDWPTVRRLVLAADSLGRADDLRRALDNYQASQQLSPDARVEGIIQQTTQLIDEAFDRYVLAGDAMRNARQYRRAVENYEKAIQLKPEESEALRQKLEDSRGRQ